jgi:DNA ligase-1
MLLVELARASTDLSSTRSRLAKTARLAEVLAALEPTEVPVAVAYLSGFLPQGNVGIGWATLRSLPSGPAGEPTIRVLEVHEALERVRVTTGAGSQAARRRILSDLFARATDQERRFLVGLLTGELRQGALEGIMVEAVARAAEVPPAEVRRAAMLAGDLTEVATVALVEGTDGLARYRLEVLRPVQPMLAQTAEDVPDAMARVGEASVEWKLDGARLQVHRSGDEVRAFTRNLADVTHRVPEVVSAMLALPVERVVLDGEAIALRPDQRPLPFQSTMSRFGTQDEQRHEVRLSAFFFDILHLDGEDLLDRPLRERLAALDDRLPEDLRVPRIATSDRDEAGRFLDDALARGHEGVMVKDLDAPYEAGRRGASWLKVKRAHTLDLVVLAVEWGHGRRQGLLSNLHLGARDPSSPGGFAMLGKTFKGMTDEMLRWQTERFLELETGRDGHVVHVRPEQVVEVAFDGVQASSKYPSGLALRFARVKGYRPDKRPDEADTLETVRAIHDGSGPSQA